MGIELATYCPELKHNENNQDNRTNTINPVDTLSSLQGDISALMLSLDAIIAAHPRRARQINSLPERLSDLVDYLERSRPSECRFVLGNWEEEVVYVNLYHAVEREWLALFHGNVNIHIFGNGGMGQCLHVWWVLCWVHRRDRHSFDFCGLPR
jgi:hypothetical protein